MILKKRLLEMAEKYNNIRLIILFGSYARNDYDENSDIDVFLLIDDCDFSKYIDFKDNLCNDLSVPLDYVSIYTDIGFMKLKQKGSYFLWHLKLEGLIIFDRRKEFNKLFNNIGKYKSAKDDLIEYREICDDISNEKRYYADKDINYDISVLASIVRNTCIAISYLKGVYVFDRIKPVEYVKEIMGIDFPFELSEYKRIYYYRISKNRDIKIEMSQPSDEDVKNWCKKAQALVEYGLNIVNVE